MLWFGDVLKEDFRGTQNNGGTSFESDLFDDLSADAFYTITSTGENTLEVNYGQ